jgi:hypothetical protein
MVKALSAEDVAETLRMIAGSSLTTPEECDILHRGADLLSSVKGLEEKLAEAADALATATQFTQGEEYEQQEFCLAAAKSARAALAPSQEK